MSTFPTLYLYNPKNKRDKDTISYELHSGFIERVPQAINSFFLKKSLQEFMWIATVKRGDKYSWGLHDPLESSFKLLEVINVTDDL